MIDRFVRLWRKERVTQLANGPVVIVDRGKLTLQIRGGLCTPSVIGIANCDNTEIGTLYNITATIKGYCSFFFTRSKKINENFYLFIFYESSRWYFREILDETTTTVNVTFHGKSIEIFIEMTTKLLLISKSFGINFKRVVEHIIGVVVVNEVDITRHI